MTDSAEAKNDFAVEASIPDGITSLDSILCTEELHRRPWRSPDYEKENCALVALASALADPQSNILQTLAETILDVTQSDSSGLSLLTKDDGGKRFYWPAIAGMWSPHVGGGTPRDFGPCGDVLDRNRTLLFQHFERRYPYLLPVMPAAEECLLVPFCVGGKAVGTIWAIMHSDRRKFDAEDERLMSTLGQFASLAYQTVQSIEDLKSQIFGREKAEAAVRALASGLEAKVRRLIEANIMGIFIWNDDKIVEANEAFLHLVGYDRDELTSGGLRWRELTPPEWRGADDRSVAELEATGTAQPYEKEYFRKNGSRVPVLVGAATFEGRSDEGVAFVLDLTDRKSADEAVRASELRWRTMFEKFPVGIVLRDADQRYMAANPAFQEMVGYSEQELTHLSPLDITHEDDRPASERMLAEFQAGVRQSAEKEKRFRRKDGAAIWTMLSTFRIPETGPIPAFYPAIVVDITKRKQAEEALRESELELARVSRLTTMGELAASIAHEVNQPIAAARNNAASALRFLSRSPPDLEEVREALDCVVSDVDRAGNVIGGIRKLITKTPAPRDDCLDINEAIREMIVLTHGEVLKIGVSVQMQLKGLPLIQGDRVQLQQVVLNLILNAVEAMSSVDGARRELSISTERRGADEVLVAVRDSGPGIDPEHLERVFDSFYTTKPSGIGLGLSICRSIIDAHGGRLWAAANEPRGAAFQFILPAGN